MKNTESGENRKPEKARGRESDKKSDEMSEMENFLRKKRLQNEVLKKLTEK